MSATCFDLPPSSARRRDDAPDHKVSGWRDKRLTYAEMDARIGDGRRHSSAGLWLPPQARFSSRATRSGGTIRVCICATATSTWSADARRLLRAVAPFNVNYRYVEEEPLYPLRRR